jgi:putative hydrolase of the HAD superfamily
MVQAVVFDWFGTLAQWPDGPASNYESIFLSHGQRIDPDVFDRYHARRDGIDHAEHSTSRVAYLQWTRRRLTELAEHCGVPEGRRSALVDDIIDLDSRGPMVTFPETLEVLGELRQRGVAVGVCSNWGWDLDVALESTGVAPFVDVPVTSARAGCRKPHPAIYEIMVSALDVAPSQTVFVGDSWEPDVLGPIRAGMASVHVCRDPTRSQPELVSGAQRVSSLGQLFQLEAFAIGSEAS